jgi:murein DD-endopeptidase MepM/ murein hydrolase activator NlpD
MNNLRAPFALNVGQKIRVPDLPDAKPAGATVAPAKATTKSGATKTLTTKPEKNKTGKPTEKTGAKQTTKPAPTKTETKKTQSKAETKPAQKTQTKTTEKNATTKAQTVPARSASKFTWPVRGTILSHYGAKSGGLYNDGINISAATGATVVAAENGVVAYAGNEVRGMGNLIIIQHADGWMTVYAHLNSMSVRRGARVNVGQKIGTVGQTGKVTKPQLHFEIRKGTKSYNPTQYLKK